MNVLLAPGMCRNDDAAVALADRMLVDIREEEEGVVDERLQQAILVACLRRCSGSHDAGEELRVQGKLLQAVVEHGESGRLLLDPSLLAPVTQALIPYVDVKEGDENGMRMQLQALRCLPFLVKKVESPLSKQLTQACLSPIKALASRAGGDAVVQSLAIRALVQLGVGSDLLNKINSRLLEDLGSISSMSICRLQALLQITQSLATNQRTSDVLVTKVLPILVPALRSPSHVIRMTALQVLTCYAPPHYLEPTNEKEKESPLQGPCPVLTLLQEVEGLPISVAAEREYSLRLGKLEVMARSGRIPPLLHEALATYCLGLLFVKFASVWPLAVKTFAATAEGKEDMAWRPLLAVWEYLGSLPLGEISGATGHKDGSDAMVVDDKGELLNVLHQIDYGKFGLGDLEPQQIPYVRFMTGVKVGASLPGGYVSPYSTTDPLTVTTSLISLLRQCPSLVLRRSKFVVVAFLSFLHREYFPLYPDDPEARILDLAGPQANVPDLQRNITTQPRPLTGKAARMVLQSFLELFSSLKSPKQLYHHSLLERVYCSMLTKPDPSLTRLALDALLAYKPPALVPYQESLRALLKDSTLRDELTKFNVGDLQPEHRPLVLPVLVRILFGRFLTKSSKRRSDKSASTGRYVVLSLFSHTTKLTC